MAGRPNNAAAIAVHIQGLREAKAAFQKLPEVVRNERNEVNEFTAKGVVLQAQLRLRASPSIRTGNLLNAIAYQVTKSNGTARVGISNVQTTMTVGGRKFKVKGIIIPGRGGSALTSQGAKIVKPSYYGKFVEFGTAHMKAEPFMGPASRSMREEHIRRWHQAGKSIERQMSTGGVGNL